MKTDSIILDVDGTLWDSTPVVAKAWTSALHAAGCTDMTMTADRLKQLFGKTMKVIADQMLPQMDEKTRYHIMDICCEYEHQWLENNEEDICYPGVARTIQELSRKFFVCIVSNCQAGYIELFLKKTGLAPYIRDFECYGNTGRNKGDNIRLLIGRNHFRHPVYVGDTQGDFEASKDAGVPFVFASYGFGNAEGADAVIKEFGELSSVLEPCQTAENTLPSGEAAERRLG